MLSTTSTKLVPSNRKRVKQNNKWVTQGIIYTREKLQCYYSRFRTKNNKKCQLFFLNYQHIYKIVITATTNFVIGLKLMVKKNFSKQSINMNVNWIRIKSPEEVSKYFYNYLSRHKAWINSDKWPAVLQEAVSCSCGHSETTA